MNTYTQHQVVGVIEIIQAIPNMEIGLLEQVDLQCENFIEALHILGIGIDKIVANTKVDGEIRHHELRTCREAKSHLPVPRRCFDVIILLSLFNSFSRFN